MNKLPDIWIKAAIEHVALLLVYKSVETEETSQRIIFPDWIEQTKKGILLWGWDPRKNEPRSFYAKNVQFLKYTGKKFQPNPNGKWQQLWTQYNKRKLANIPWKK